MFEAFTLVMAGRVALVEVDLKKIVALVRGTL